MVRIPACTDVPLKGVPWVNCLLVLANVAVFAVQLRRPGMMGQYMLETHGLELKQFLTYAFLHIGAGHLIFNMVVLWMLGGNINDRLGHVGYLAFYLAGAVFAGIGFVMAGGEAMVGASGAIGAVMGVYVALLPRSIIRVRLRQFVVEVPAMYFVVMFFLYNVLMSLMEGIAVQQVAYEAHVAGMVFGFGVGMMVLWLGLAPGEQEDLVGVIGRWRRKTR